MSEEVTVTANIHTKYGNDVIKTKKFILNGLVTQLSSEGEFLIIGGIIIPKSNVHHIVFQ